MPGKESLRACQYYAHPRNAFWKIMGELLGTFTALPYESRSLMLKSAGIAVWDVLASCQRSSSLDADIDTSTIAANDFNAFFASHPHIRQVFFNGHMAEKCFLKHVQPWLAPMSLHYQRLPSTSPAHAAITYEQKLEAWKVVLKNNNILPRVQADSP